MNVFNLKTKSSQFLLVILLSLFFTTSCAKSKISLLNILLPICPNSNCDPVHSKVNSEGGCFDWSVDRPDLIAIDRKKKRGEKDGCYGKAMLTTKANATHENAFITAKDKDNDVSFSCKVGFGEVYTIAIEKRFDQMNVGEVTELQVIAKDKYNNSFTSLEGWEFQWEIAERDQHKAKLMQIKSQNKKIGQYREAIENNGKYTDIVSIQAMQIGQVEISVKIVKPNIEGVYAKTTMYIAEPFEIVPKGPIYMDRNTHVDLKLRLLRSNKFITEDQFVNYKWSLDNASCGNMNDKHFGHFESGSSVCTVEVTASDVRVRRYNSDSVKIEVVVPNEVLVLYKEIPSEYKDMSLHDIDSNDSSPLRNEYQWKLVENKFYFMKMYLAYHTHPIVFNREREIFKLNDMHLKPYLDNESMKCNDITNDLCVFQTKSITNEYKRLIVSAMGGIKSEKEVMIYEQIHINKFNRNKFVLPYIDGVNGQELNLVIKGGTGKYNVKSFNYNVVDVNMHTNALYSRKEGKTIVEVVDSEIPENKDSVDIEVKQVGFISHYEERQEIRVGSVFDITPLVYHDNNNNNKYNVDSIFTNCTDLIFEHSRNSNNDKIEYVDNNSVNNVDSDNNMSTYRKVRYYVKENVNGVITAKMAFNDVASQHHEYLNYANYGICGVFNYKAINEGYTNVNSYLPNYHSNIPSNVYIYNDLSIEKTITDNYTQKVITKGGIVHPDMDKTYLIPEGQVMTLHFKGGVQQWLNPPSTFIRNTMYFDLHMNSIDKLSGLEEMNKAKQFKSFQFKGFKENNEYIIRYEISNQQDAKLLKPAKVSIDFKIGCYNPRDLAIHILSQESITEPMFEVFQQPGITYYIQRNSTEIIRVYAFDKQRRLISIMDSINKVFNTKQNKLSTDYFKEVKESERYLYGMNKHYEQSREFIQSIIHFKDIESTFDLNVEMEHLWGQHHANIHLIGLPTITPCNGTIYVYDPQPFELTIKGGSGYYEVFPNNNYLADVEYVQDTQTIYVKPKQMGTLVVNVRDKFLSSYNNANIISSTINIVDIQSIRLIGGGPVMMNNYSLIDIEVYNNLNEKFSDDIQSKLPLMIPYTKFNNYLTLSFENPNTKKQIKVSPIIIGKYGIFITYERTGLRSEEVEIEVFEPLEIFPPYLLLVPGSSFTLSINGGPKDENAKLTYVILDNKIANVSSDEPLVHALEIGETQLEIRLLYKSYYNKVYNKEEEKGELNKHSVLSIQHINVTVALPHKVEILNANHREIMTGATVRLLALIKSKSDELFTYGLGMFKFMWNIDNKHIAKIKYFTKQEVHDDLTGGPEMKCDVDNTEQCALTIENEDDAKPENSVGIFLQSQQKGVVTVSLTVEVEYPRKYDGSKIGVFTTKSDLNINDEIFANIPTFYQQQDKVTGLYMLPFNITHKLHTNQHTQQLYEKLNANEADDILTLNSNGVIQTKSKEGLVPIQITDYSKEKTLPTTLAVYVSDYRAIFVEKSHDLIDLQMNQEIQLKINIQHDNGYSFANELEGMQLRIIESHPRVATATLIQSNSIVVIKTEKIGSTNIILLNPHTRKIYDVFRINVNKDVTTLKKVVLNVGGSIKLLDKSPERKDQLTKNAEWRSSNNEVVAVNYKGEIIAKKEGTAIVQLIDKTKGTKQITLMIEVCNVYMINKNILPKRITNVKTLSDYTAKIEIPIEFVSEKGERLTLDSDDAYNTINQNIKASCYVDQPQNSFFIVENIKKGNDNICVLTPRDVSYYVDGVKPRYIDMKFKVDYIGKYKSGIELKEKVPFENGFAVKDNLSEVKLTYKKSKEMVYIDSFDNIKIEVSDENKVKVTKREEKKCIEIAIVNEDVDDFMSVEVVIKNELTSQKHSINVSYKNTSGNTIFFGLMKQETFYDFLTFVMLIASILVLCYYMTENDKSGNNNDQHQHQRYHSDRARFGNNTPGYRPQPQYGAHFNTGMN